MSIFNHIFTSKFNMRTIPALLTLLNNEFENFVIINLSNKTEDLQKYKLSLSSKSKSVECDLNIDYLDDGNLRLEIIYDKLLKKLIENTTKQKTVYVFKKEEVEYFLHDEDRIQRIMYRQFQVVFAYLALIENKNEKQKLKLI